MKLTLGVFTGAVKALHPKLVGDTAGVDSRNQKPGRGDFRPWRSPVTVATVPAGRQTIYRMGRDTKSDAASWLSWPTRVHLMRGYNAEDTTERTYLTGDGPPKWTDNTMALTAPPYPSATLGLGVPAPVNTVESGILRPFSAVGLGSWTDPTVETRAYTYTYVNTKGEESAPGPIAINTFHKDEWARITYISVPPAGYGIDRVRIYVTVSGLSGDTDFFFMNELAAPAVFFPYTFINDELLARGEQIPTDGALPPPSNLRCLTPMWNGMAAAISGKGVRVCAPFQINSWPLFNEFLPPDSTPIGLGVWGQRLLVLSTAQPQLITGASPDGLDMQPTDGQACSSEPSIVSFDHGVAYACEDGLAYYGSAGPKLLTAGLFTRDDWQAMNPSTMVAGQYEGAYVCFYTDAAAVRRGFIIDPLNPQGVFFLDTGYSALFFDKLQDALFVLDGTNIKKWDAPGAANMTATYVSKQWVTPTVNFRWGKVTADAYPVTLMIDAGPFTAQEQTDMAGLLADFPSELAFVGAYLRATHTVNSAEAFELHAGFEATEWQLRLVSTQPVQAAVLATTVEETA